MSLLFTIFEAIAHLTAPFERLLHVKLIINRNQGIVNSQIAPQVAAASAMLRPVGHFLR